MQSQGKKLIQELKAHLLDTMQGLPECSPGGPGCSYREIQDLARPESRSSGPRRLAYMVTISSNG